MRNSLLVSVLYYSTTLKRGSIWSDSPKVHVYGITSFFDQHYIVQRQ